MARTRRRSRRAGSSVLAAGAVALAAAGWAAAAASAAPGGTCPSVQAVRLQAPVMVKHTESANLLELQRLAVQAREEALGGGEAAVRAALEPVLEALYAATDAAGVAAAVAALEGLAGPALLNVTACFAPHFAPLRVWGEYARRGALPPLEDLGFPAATAVEMAALWHVAALALSGVGGRLTAAEALRATGMAAEAGVPEARLARADGWFTGRRPGAEPAADCDAAFDLLQAEALQLKPGTLYPLAEPPSVRDRHRYGGSYVTTAESPAAYGYDGDAAFLEDWEETNGDWEWGSLFGAGVGPRDPGGASGARRTTSGIIDAMQAGWHAGEVHDAFDMGYASLLGLGVPQNDTRAAEIFGELARRGHGPAFTARGVMAFNGWMPGMPRNRTAASLDWEQAVQLSGDVDALYNLGYLYSREGEAAEAGQRDLPNRTLSREYEYALSYFQEASDAGHWSALLKLGEHNAKGLGTPRDCEVGYQATKTFLHENLRWNYLQAAAFEMLDGPPSRPFGAFVLFSLLAEQGAGDGAAASNAAWVLQLDLKRAAGRNFTPIFPRDRLAAMLLERLELAVMQGRNDALVDLGAAFADRDLLGSEAAGASPVDYFKSAAEAGEPEGYYLLALSHWFGRHGQPQDLQEAQRQLRTGLREVRVDGSWAEEAILVGALALLRCNLLLRRAQDLLSSKGGVQGEFLFVVLISTAATFLVFRIVGYCSATRRIWVNPA